MNCITICENLLNLKDKQKSFISKGFDSILLVFTSQQKTRFQIYKKE